MSVINNNLLLTAPAGGATAGRSVRFNAPDSAYLSRTPASAGNQKLWTFSFWYKTVLQDASNRRHIFTARDGSGNHAVLNFRGSDDKLEIYYYAGSLQFQVLTTAIFRDPSAWYHVVVAYDTDQATASNRIKLYVNGTQITAFDTANYPTLGYSSALWNSTNAHAIGRENTVHLSGYLALVHFIDGQALTPSSFGETSATTGQWIAKTYSGSYGTNGFFLDFLDNSTAAALGYDAAGSNDWTVNNIKATVSATNRSLYAASASDYISTSIGSNITLNDFTLEGWVYFTNGALNCAIHSPDGTAGLQVRWTTSGTQFHIEMTNSAFILSSGTQTFNNNTWYHVVATRSGSSVALGINGTFVATGTSSASIFVDSGFPLTVGRNYNGGAHNPFYFSNVRLSSTARYGTSGSYTVPTSALTSDGNTIYLVANTSTVTNDSKGTYTWTANGSISASTSNPFGTAADIDSLRDHPTSAGTSTGLGGEVSGNYATWNPLAITATGRTYSDGNLKCVTGSTEYKIIVPTIYYPVGYGKWFCEITVENLTADTTIGAIYASSIDGSANQAPGYTTNSVGYQFNGNKAQNASVSAYGASYTDGDIIGVAFDAENGSITFYKNGVSQGVAFSSLSTTNQWTLAVSDFDNTASGSGTYILNAGQRAFAYTAPSGFSPLVDTLLPTPTIAKPNTVMDVVTYTGNGSSSRAITGLNFSPDFVWTKSRNQAYSHYLFDAVRGANKALFSDTTDSEQTYTSYLLSFDSAGFTVGNGSQINANGDTYVGWTWDAGSSNTTNTSGTITSTVRANISAGFSIVTYTGNGGTATVGHGLGVTPSLVVVKSRSTAGEWPVWFTGFSATEYMYLHSTLAKTSYSPTWGSTPTSSVFGVTGGSGINNNNGTTYVAYCWAPVAGYSAFGSYTGNGSSDGPFVYTGFRPRWVLIKMSSSTGSWYLIDTARLGYNPDNNPLYPNLTADEQTDDIADILSNGFKIRNSFAGVNTSSGTYVWAAFAENPFAYARAR